MAGPDMTKPRKPRAAGEHGKPRPNSRKYSPEQRQRAKYLCVEENLKLVEISDRTGVPVTTLKKWSREEKWQQVQRGKADYNKGVGELKVALLNKAKDSLKSEDISDWIGVERVFPEKTYGDKGLRREFMVSTFEEFVPFVASQEGMTAALLSQFQSLVTAFLARVRD